MKWHEMRWNETKWHEMNELMNEWMNEWKAAKKELMTCKKCMNETERNEILWSEVTWNAMKYRHTPTKERMKIWKHQHMNAWMKRRNEIKWNETK